MKTEEGRALRRQWSTKPRRNAGRPRGVPDGCREQIEPIRTQIKDEAKRIVMKMSQDYNIEDEYAKTALEAVVEVMRCPGDNRERVAARLVLVHKE